MKKKKVRVRMTERWVAAQLLLFIAPRLGAIHHELFRVRGPHFYREGLTPKEIDRVERWMKDLDRIMREMGELGMRLKRTTTYTPNAS